MMLSPNNLYLEEVILPNGIESIQSYAFKNCTNLTNINAPASNKSTLQSF